MYWSMIKYNKHMILLWPIVEHMGACQFYLATICFATSLLKCYEKMLYSPMIIRKEGTLLTYYSIHRKSLICPRIFHKIHCLIHTTQRENILVTQKALRPVQAWKVLFVQFNSLLGNQKLWGVREGKRW